MRLILCTLIALFGFAMSAAAEKRIALVIGNSNYETVGWDLENPVNDAELLAGALENVGFEVHTVLDGTKTGMEEAFQGPCRSTERRRRGCRRLFSSMLATAPSIEV